MRVGLVQLNSTDNKRDNLTQAEAVISQVAAVGVDLVLLPEMANYRGTDEANAAAAESLPGPTYEWAQNLARHYQIVFHLGSLIESRGGKLFNTSAVFDQTGTEIARYSKIHLFDAQLPNGMSYHESKAISPGGELAVFAHQGVTFGLAICYDLRFPELFRALAKLGAEVFLVPAAFTVPTGSNHWEPLVRARAIENGCYVAACGQWGPSPVGKDGYGHSMVVDPWGTVVGQCSEKVGYAVAEIDLEYLRLVRQRLPVLQQCRSELFC